MATEIRMPRLSSSMLEGRIVRWYKRVGDRVNQGEALLEIESDKAVSDVEASASGVLLQIAAGDDSVVDVDGLLGAIGEEGEAGVPATAATQAAAAQTVGAAPGVQPSLQRAGKVKASPVAKRLAAKFGVSLDDIVGSGRDGLIVEADVLAARDAAPSSMGEGEDEVGDVVSLTGIQAAMLRHMVEVGRNVVQATTFAEVRMLRAMEARRQAKISITTLVAWAAVRAIQDFPVINSCLQEGNRLLLRKQVNLSVAVASPKGLVVPVIRGAHRLGIQELSNQVESLAERARVGQLAPSDFEGGSFTLTNSGSLGALLSAPVVNYPEVAILAAGKVADWPIAVDGQVVVQPLMYLSLSYDHRVIDGAAAIGFVQKVKRLLEEQPLG
ncbi:MAG TPA: dihydrolipoamide acetyltransferase family protein [Chloroflexota bacterium]|nr:dihydrolipoamide acetyltransferase family protein [Chloroflexota bacterium]